MNIANHYQILVVSPLATKEEIKKAYRSLARQYHPDKNQDNPRATEYFQEIQNAYEVLYDANSRKKYDYMLRQHGLYDAYSGKTINNETDILTSSATLVQYVSAQRQVNADALTDYILAMLTKEQIAIILRKNNSDVNSQIVKNIIAASKGVMTMRLYQQIHEVLLPLISTEGDDAIMHLIIAEYQKRAQQEKQQKLVTFLTIILVVVLLIATLFML
ncbi:MAG: J domain-containing protein [Chitinophagaceae bacterium]|nr:J domain-containing protein [Chitinophagaceae bacterium]